MQSDQQAIDRFEGKFDVKFPGLSSVRTTLPSEVEAKAKVGKVDESEFHSQTYPKGGFFSFPKEHTKTTS